MTSAWEALRDFPSTVSQEVVLKSLPDTNNSNLSSLITKVVRLAEGKMSWEALSWALIVAFTAHQRWQAETHIELLWSGPSPANQISARRIDQVIYDLIDNAKHEILLVTFAAAKIKILTEKLMAAASRGVAIRLIFEFEQASEGQLSYDAAKAFPKALLACAKVFYWPLEKREKNKSGHPGKLHAKAAIIDGVALISSANLTDDAFNRNLELGVLFQEQDVVSRLGEHIDQLITSGTLVQWR